MRGQHPSAGATRIVLLAACCALVAAVNAAGLGGTFSTQGAQGKVVARLEVRGERLVGYIDFAGRTRVNLVGAIQGSSARGSATSKEGIGEFEAEVAGDTLNLVLSQKDGPNQRAARLPLMLQREGGTRAALGGDARLVGQWTHQDMIVSGNASFASEERLQFRADGSYAYGRGPAAAGGADWSFDGGRGNDVEHGLWRTENGVLYVGDGARWNRVGTYAQTEDGSAMRISYDGGGRKVWVRRK